VGYGWPAEELGARGRGEDRFEPVVDGGWKRSRPVTVSGAAAASANLFCVDIGIADFWAFYLIGCVKSRAVSKTGWE
jgi:hypothetical protein